MQVLIGQIRERLQRSAYVNEAAISHGVVMPIINALGWDTADPQQVVPEFSISGGRVDFALFGLGHKPAWGWKTPTPPDPASDRAQNGRLAIQHIHGKA